MHIPDADDLRDQMKQEPGPVFLKRLNPQNVRSSTQKKIGDFGLLPIRNGRTGAHHPWLHLKSYVLPPLTDAKQMEGLAIMGEREEGILSRSNKMRMFACRSVHIIELNHSSGTNTLTISRPSVHL